MNIKKKLLNPFVLGAQGFIAGAILFWSTHPAESSAPPPASGARRRACANATGTAATAFRNGRGKC